MSNNCRHVREGAVEYVVEVVVSVFVFDTFLTSESISLHFSHYKK